MYLSDREILKALNTKQLIIEPRPNRKDIGATSVDLHLDSVDKARVWNMDAFRETTNALGAELHELRIGKFDYRKFSNKYTMPPPENNDAKNLTFKRGAQIIVRPRGFVLWQTREIVGTHEKTGKLICFIDGKSTKARTGLLVHLTAPTIHAKWNGHVTLEIANLGPFDFVLEAGDVVAQITVARISSIPLYNSKVSESNTIGQVNVTGRPNGIAQ